MRVIPALGWALTWSLGAALGVALGGYLILVSGSGAPGEQAIDPVTDLVLLPAIAFGVVFVVHLAGQFTVALVRGRRLSGLPGDGHERE